MDAARFDSLTKLLSHSQSRRSLLDGTLSGVLAGAFSVLLIEPAGAKQCKGVSKRCKSNDDCCSTLFCEPTSRQCVATCTQGEGICSALAPCAPGCSCYRHAFTGVRVCLQDPADPPACADLQVCLDSDDECPRGHLCTASSCCTGAGDAVCLPLCEAFIG